VKSADNIGFNQIRRSKTYIVVLLGSATLSACAPLAEVHETHPRIGAQHGTRAEQAVAAGQELQRNDPQKAIGSYLAGVELAASELRKSPKDRLALRNYNFALSRVFSVIRDTHLDPWSHPLQVPVPADGEYLLTQRRVANRLWQPQDYELIPADELDVSGKFVVPRLTRDGAGAALIAVRREQAPQIPLRFLHLVFILRLPQ